MCEEKQNSSDLIRAIFEKHLNAYKAEVTEVLNQTTDKTQQALIKDILKLTDTWKENTEFYNSVLKKYEDNPEN